MGMGGKNAQTLSVNTSKLALDLASLNNVSFNQALADLRSGLVGQSETVYKYGIDVTEASIKQTAFAMGIEKSVRNMSQGEKMALRYATMIRQTTLAHGDFARTLNTPANQLKILSERFVTLKRAIGNMFVTGLGQVLPYINAFLSILTDLANKVAMMFGYVPSQVKPVTTAIDGIKEGADDGTDSIEKMGKAIKNATLGIDELNVLDKNAGKGENDGASILGSIDLKPYDNLMNKVNGINDELKAKLKPILEDVLRVVGLIAIGFGSWKVAWALVDFITSPKLSAFENTVKSIGTAFKTMNVSSLTSSLGGVTLIVAGIAATIAVMVLRFIELYKKSESFRLGLEAIWTATVKVSEAIGKFFVENFSGIAKFFEEMDAGVGDFIITAGGIALLFTPAAPFGVALLAFEAITVAIRAIGVAVSDSIGEVKLFGDDISETTQKKVDPFIKSMDNIDKTLKKIKWSGEIIDSTTLANVKSQLKEVTDMIVAELDSDKNEALNKLQPLKNALGQDEFDSLVKASNEHYETMKKDVESKEKEITSLLEGLNSGRIKDKEKTYARIEELESSMKKTGIKYLSETQTESNLIMQTLVDNNTALSARQASDIIKDSLNVKNQTVDNANKQYNDIMTEAQRMLDVGAISKEQYDKIRKSATETKDSTIKDAEEQHKRITDEAMKQAGDLSKNIDDSTGEIKSKWRVFWEDTGKFWSDWWNNDVKPWFTKKKWEEVAQNMADGLESKWNDFKKWWNNTAIVKWWNEDVAPWFTKEKWIEVAGGLKEGLVTTFKNAIEGARNLFNTFIKWINDKMSFTWDAFTIKGKEIIPAGNIKLFTIPEIPKLFADGGFPEMGSMFVANEAGAELVGNINGKTAVVNNDQIVEAVSKGVAKAVASVIDGQNERPIVVTLDGEKIYSNQEKIRQNRGYNFGMGVFAR
jgi:hypothetical protein